MPETCLWEAPTTFGRRALVPFYHRGVPTLSVLDFDFAPQTPPYYNNLSMENVAIQKIYRENLDKLMEIRAKYDKNDVMGRCGTTHKIPLPGQAVNYVDDGH